VAGLSPSFGFGASTNPWPDLVNARSILLAGSNAADNHPLAMQYVLAAKASGAKIIVVDPRLTATAAHADIHAKLRPGTDIAYLGALINYLLANNLYDRDYLINNTNALLRIKPEFAFSEGLFSGYDSKNNSYQTNTWAYVLDSDGNPLKADSLEESGTVFSQLRAHFARYDFSTASAICGIPADTIKAIAQTIAANRPLSIIYALGITQHTTASQGIRCYAIISLLLGSVGVAGGGVNALRGDPNVQGSTDLGTLSTNLPGYIPTPQDTANNLAAYTTSHGLIARNNLIALLAAWFGPHASADEDYGYNLLPRIDSNKPSTYTAMLADMATGQFKLAFTFGINPLMSTVNNQIVEQALAKLDMLVVVDMFETETAEFWKSPKFIAQTKTEVLFLPAAFFHEKSGSITNSSRWIQWKNQVVPPEGQAKSDLVIIDLLFKQVRHLYKQYPTSKDAPILKANWDYGNPADPNKVLQEINGYHLGNGKPLASYAEYLSAAEGSVACGCWLYAGIFPGSNLATRRKISDPGGLGLFPDWAYSWPGNTRILYNRASCDNQGAVRPHFHPLIWWNKDTERWQGYDQPDMPNCAEELQGAVAFWATAEGRARLFAAPYERLVHDNNVSYLISAICADGPLPEYYEPVESPVANILHPRVSANPMVKAPGRLTHFNKLGTANDFPYVLTTYAPPLQNSPPPSESGLLKIQIGSALAANLNILDGDMVEVSSARGGITALACVVSSLSPLFIGKKEIHTVAIPADWRTANLSAAKTVNVLMHAFVDIGAGSPESKTCLVNIRKKNNQALLPGK
jgi:formate dehydrogenase major subunit